MLLNRLEYDLESTKGAGAIEDGMGNKPTPVPHRRTNEHGTLATHSVPISEIRSTWEKWTSRNPSMTPVESASHMFTEIGIEKVNQSDMFHLIFCGISVLGFLVFSSKPKQSLAYMLDRLVHTKTLCNPQTGAQIVHIGWLMLEQRSFHWQIPTVSDAKEEP